jgi:hypothetical protein
MMKTKNGDTHDYDSAIPSFLGCDSTEPSAKSIVRREPVEAEDIRVQQGAPPPLNEACEICVQRLRPACIHLETLDFRWDDNRFP